MSRIQGETVDYTIYYIPSRNQRFAFSENLFNITTSHSKSTTLLISDMPLDIIPINTNKVMQFLSHCKNVDLTPKGDIDRNNVKQHYSGLEDLVDELLNNNIKFSLDGDSNLIDYDKVVIASTRMVLTEKHVAIDLKIMNQKFNLKLLDIRLCLQKISK